VPTPRRPENTDRRQDDRTALARQDDLEKQAQAGKQTTGALEDATRPAACRRPWRAATRRGCGAVEAKVFAL